MLDLCCGLKGASAAMREAGWDVVTLDIDPRFTPDIVADVCTWQWDGTVFDLVWASPPCDEFARESMPWSRTGAEPDMSIMSACWRIAEAINPRVFILENVRGAVRWLGEPRQRIGNVYLWGWFPPLGKPGIGKRKKESFSSAQRAERARIPHEISRAVLIACGQGELL
jgi:site-specific DNA-cytosine methylase